MSQFSKIAFITLAFVAIALPVFSFASDVSIISTDLPTIQVGSFSPPIVPIAGEGGKGPLAILVNFYYLALGLGGALAFSMILWGAIKYMTAGGSHSAVDEAKEIVTEAFLGLLLLVGAYLVLSVVNPDLTNLQLPFLERLEPAKKSEGPPNVDIGASGSGGCEAHKLLYAGSKCVESEGVQEIVACVKSKNGPSPSATIGGVHSITSCHFGGKTCLDGGHAIDYGIKQSAPLTLREVASIVASCKAQTGNQVECFYENPSPKGNETIRRDEKGVLYTATDPRVNHLHCNVNIATCGCN